MRWEWQMKKPVEILLDNAVSVLIAASGITGALSFLIADAAKAWQEHPAAMCLTVSASVLAGILIACCLGVREAVRDEKKAECERRIAQEQEATARKIDAERLEAERKAEQEMREAYLSREVRQMDFDAKRFLYEVYEQGPQIIGYMCDDYDLSCEIERCRLLVGETAEEGMVYDLTDEGRTFLDRHPELLARAKESIAIEREWLHHGE